MSKTDYKNACCNDYEARKQLFSEVLGLDYIKGPTKTFEVKKRLSPVIGLSSNDDSLVDKLAESNNTKIPMSEHKLNESGYLSTLVDFHLIAEFYMEIKSQTPKRATVLNSLKDVAPYLKSQNENLLAFYFRNKKSVSFVRVERVGDQNIRYIDLTENGEKAFSQLWSCSNRHTEIPFSKFESRNSDIITEGDAEDVTVISKEEKHEPSLLIENRYGSTGLEEDSAPDEDVVGSRKSIRSVPRSSMN